MSIWAITTDGTKPIDELSDADRVGILLAHAEAYRLGNLRLWCKVWLDPTSDDARKLAEQKLRAWVERADLTQDALL